MAVKLVCMCNELSNLNLWISDLRNCWQLLITIGLHKIVSKGRIASGYSCYASKHKIIMGIVVLLTRNPQLSKSISIVDRIEFDSKCHCLVMKRSIWILVSGNDWLFGYLMNVSGVHTAGRSYVMTCKSQTSREGFPWKWVSGETPLDILKCLICTACLVITWVRWYRLCR